MTEFVDVVIARLKEAIEGPAYKLHLGDVDRLLAWFEVKSALCDNATNEISSLRHSSEVLKEKLAELQEQCDGYKDEIEVLEYEIKEACET